jgi:uncharacterized protein (DUF736 family)
MSYEAKPNTGTLWKNDRKEKDTQPDYRGDLDVDGRKLEISAWIKTKKDGSKFMSLSVKEPYQKSGHAADVGKASGGAGGGYSGLDDEIPFGYEWR